jgi:hypothetical protein
VPSNIQCMFHYACVGGTGPLEAYFAADGQLRVYTKTVSFRIRVWQHCAVAITSFTTHTQVILLWNEVRSFVCNSGSWKQCPPSTSNCKHESPLYIILYGVLLFFLVCDIPFTVKYRVFHSKRLCRLYCHMYKRALRVYHCHRLKTHLQLK